MKNIFQKSGAQLRARTRAPFFCTVMLMLLSLMPLAAADQTRFITMEIYPAEAAAEGCTATSTFVSGSGSRDRITLTATPGSGWVFVRWIWEGISGGNEARNAQTFNFTQSTTVKAYFTRASTPTYSLSLGVYNGEYGLEYFTRDNYSTRAAKYGRIANGFDVDASPGPRTVFYEGELNYIKTDQGGITEIGAAESKFVKWSNGVKDIYQWITVASDNLEFIAYYVANDAPERTITILTSGSGTATGDGDYYDDVPAFLTAVPDDGATFDHWENGSGVNVSTDNPYKFTVSGNATYTAVFSGGSAPTPTHEVTATVSPAGAGTVTGTGTYDEGTDVTLTATPTNRRYRFVRWTESASEVGTAASYTISSIAAAHTLVAEFEEIPVTIADNENSSYYSSTLSTFNTTMDFRLMRTFKAGMWNTVCFPFDLTSAQRGNSDMSGVTFYTLTSVTGDAAVGLDFNVTAVATETMTARTPYLVQFTGADIVNPVFEDVTLAASAFTNNSGTDIGQNFTFFGTLCPTALEQGQANGYLFLGQDNALYWPNTANPIRAFRAYFYTSSPVVQSVHPRARIVVRTETPTGIEQTAGDADGSSAVNARKYLQGGVLVIEKNGIRYNAVGQPLSE